MKYTREKTYRYVVMDVDRHGNKRYYFRQRGKPKVRIDETPGTEEFDRLYQACLEGTLVGKAAKKKGGEKGGGPEPGSLSELVEAYYKSRLFADLNKKSKYERTRILTRLCEEHGSLPAGKLQDDNVRDLVDARADKWGAANALLMALRVLYDFGTETKRVSHNPARAVKYVRTTNPDGHHEWSRAEMEQYRAYHPVGTMPRLAMELAFWTDQRISDVHKLGKQHVRPDGTLHFVQEKNKDRRDRRPVVMDIPIWPQLREVIDATKTGDLNFIVSATGRPFGTSKHLGGAFRRWCDQAGLPSNCTMHGLRKAYLNWLVEEGHAQGETDLMAWSGHTTSQQVGHYIKRHDRSKVAARVMNRAQIATLTTAPTAEQTVDECVPPKRAG